MNLALTVFFKELATLPRQKRFYLKRSGLVLLGAVILLWALGMQNQSDATASGLMLFSSLSMVTLCAACLMSVMSASSLIMREKEERTLGLLFLSDVSSTIFVLGKIFTSIFSMVMTMLSLLPLYMLAISLGGISAAQILAAFSVLLGVLFLGSCVGVFGATVAENERHMNGILTLIWLGFLAILPTVVLLIYVYFDKSPSPRLMSVISPFVAMTSAIEGTRILYSFLDVAFCVLIGLPFVLIAAFILPKKVISKERPKLALRWRERMKANKSLRKWVVPELITGNPVAWKDFHYWHGGGRATGLKFGISLSVILLIVLLVNLKLESSLKTIFESWFITVCIYSFGIFSLGSISHFGMMFHRERKSQALEILLTTSMTDEEIVLGKIRAVFLSLMPWLISSVVCLVTLMLRYGDKSEFWEAFTYGFLEWGAMWFGLSAVAMWVSLRYRKNQAMPVCIVIFMLWNTLGRAMISPFLMWGGGRGVVGSLVCMDVAVFSIGGIVALVNVFSKFRSLALVDANRG